MNNGEGGDPNVIAFRLRDNPSPVAHGLPKFEREFLNTLEEGLCSLEDDLFEEADQAAIDSEDVFIKRFRFDAPRRDRKRLIQLKHHADLTDREIRLLNRAGSLLFGATSASISAPMILVIWGWIQLLLLFVLMLLAFLLAGRTPMPPALQMAKLLAIEATLSVICWAVFQMYIRPHRIQQRVIRRGRSSCRPEEHGLGI
jgi:hypothetical protein